MSVRNRVQMFENSPQKRWGGRTDDQATIESSSSSFSSKKQTHPFNNLGHGTGASWKSSQQYLASHSLSLSKSSHEEESSSYNHQMAIKASGSNNMSTLQEDWPGSKDEDDAYGPEIRSPDEQHRTAGVPTGREQGPFKQIVQQSSIEEAREDVPLVVNEDWPDYQKGNGGRENAGRTSEIIAQRDASLSSGRDSPPRTRTQRLVRTKKVIHRKRASSLKQSLDAASVVLEEEKSTAGSSTASSRSSLSNHELSSIAYRALSIAMKKSADEQSIAESPDKKAEDDTKVKTHPVFGYSTKPKTEEDDNDCASVSSSLSNVRPGLAAALMATKLGSSSGAKDGLRRRALLAAAQKRRSTYGLIKPPTSTEKQSTSAASPSPEDQSVDGVSRLEDRASRVVAIKKACSSPMNVPITTMIPPKADNAETTSGDVPNQLVIESEPEKEEGQLDTRPQAESPVAHSTVSGITIDSKCRLSKHPALLARSPRALKPLTAMSTAETNASVNEEEIAEVPDKTPTSEVDEVPAITQDGSTSHIDEPTPFEEDNEIRQSSTAGGTSHFSVQHSTLGGAESNSQLGDEVRAETEEAIKTLSKYEEIARKVKEASETFIYDQADLKQSVENMESSGNNYHSFVQEVHNEDHTSVAPSVASKEINPMFSKSDQSEPSKFMQDAMEETAGSTKEEDQAAENEEVAIEEHAHASTVLSNDRSGTELEQREMEAIGSDITESIPGTATASLSMSPKKQMLEKNNDSANLSVIASRSEESTHVEEAEVGAEPTEQVNNRARNGSKKKKTARRKQRPVYDSDEGSVNSLLSEDMLPPISNSFFAQFGCGIIDTLSNATGFPLGGGMCSPDVPTSRKKSKKQIYDDEQSQYTDAQSYASVASSPRSQTTQEEYEDEAPNEGSEKQEGSPGDKRDVHAAFEKAKEAAKENIIENASNNVASEMVREQSLAEGTKLTASTRSDTYISTKSKGTSYYADFNYSAPADSQLSPENKPTSPFAETPVLLSFSQRSLIEQFTRQLSTEAVEVLKLNSRNQWQPRYFTISKEKIALSAHEARNKSGDVAQCPKALLWLKKFNPKNGGYGQGHIDKSGHGGMMLIELTDITVSNKKADPKHPYPKKFAAKFENSVSIHLDYTVNGGFRSVSFRCKSDEEAQFLCTCMRVVRDLLKREKMLRTQPNGAASKAPAAATPSSKLYEL